MSRWLMEWRLLRRSPFAFWTLLLLAALTCAGLAAGMSEVARQREVIERIQPQQAADVAAIADWVDRDKDAGNAAYYTFHATWDPPSDLAFAALGFRDVAPYVLRVRALGLEAQLYEGENLNPELALPGRFDFAFVLVYLVPLFVIALFHDLVSGEREAGRMPALKASPGGGTSLWLRRGALRFLLVLIAVGVPFAIAAALSGVAAALVAAVLGITALYIGFWVGVSALVMRLGRGSVTNAAVLAASWLVLTLVAPAIGQSAINSAVPVRQGVELTLAHRDQVHRAWEIPKQAIMARFLASHPEWRDTPPLDHRFHWKWYFAFHQVGDEAVKPMAAEYRERLQERDKWSARLGWLLPPVGVQLLLARMAGTDLEAQLAYQDRVRAYHAELRRFYYPYLFNEAPFGKADFARAPQFAAAGR